MKFRLRTLRRSYGTDDGGAHALGAGTAEHGVDASELIGPDQVDAALRALTGLIALEGGQHPWVGEGSDTMLLPLSVLPEKFHRGRASLPAANGKPIAPVSLPCLGERPPCLGGCGQTPVGRRSQFMPGHDHRVNPATAGGGTGCRSHAPGRRTELEHTLTNRP